MKARSLIASLAIGEGVAGYFKKKSVAAPIAPEKDPQREAWRIHAEPNAILGSGRPGKTVSDFDKLGGIAIDSKGRIYAVDAHLNEVFRYAPDGASDASWKFAKQRSDGETYLAIADQCNYRLAV